MNNTERLAQTTAVVAVALVAAVWLALPARDLSILVLGNTLRASISSVWQFGLVAVAIGLVGGHHIAVATIGTDDGFSTAWALPAAVLASGVFFIDLLPGSLMGTLVALLSCALFGIVVDFQCKAGGEYSVRRQVIRQLLVLMTFGFAGILFFALARYSLGIVPRVAGVAVITTGLASAILRYVGVSHREVWFYSGLVGLLLAELEMGLAFLVMPARMAAGVLFLAFYVLTGMVQQYLWGRMRPRVFVEYAIVSTLGLLLLYFVLR